MRLMRRADNHLASRRLHLDMHKVAVAMQESDLVKEVVSGMTEPRRQRLSLALRAGEFERRERLDQMAGLDFFARLGGVETDRLGRGARHDGAPGRGAANHGERGHDDESLCYRNAAGPCSHCRLNAM